MARSPIEPMLVTANGEFGIIRNVAPSGSDNEFFRPGGHYALDLYGPRGTKVHAPADCKVAAIWRNNDTRPWRGLGPVGYLLDTLDGYFHVIAHMQYQYWESHGYKPIGHAFKEGDLLGVTSGLDHVHWEVRKPKFEKGNQTRKDITMNPRAWIEMRNKKDTTPVEAATTSATIAVAASAVGLAVIADKLKG